MLVLLHQCIGEVLSSFMLENPDYTTFSFEELAQKRDVFKTTENKINILKEKIHKEISYTHSEEITEK